LLAVGYPKADSSGKRKRKPIEKIVFSEKWGEPFMISDE
jgi:hypothetical protein